MNKLCHNDGNKVIHQNLIAKRILKHAIITAHGLTKKCMVMPKPKTIAAAV